MYCKNPTAPKNILQCQPTSAKAAVKPGQLPGAATDGNSGTRWQPLSSEKTHLKIILDDSVPFQMIEEIRIKWGPRPAVQARIGLSNTTSIDALDHPDVRTIKLTKIRPIQVYGHDIPNVGVLPYVGNSTILKLGTSHEPYWSGRVALLETEGCYECGVSEWLNENGTAITEDDRFGATVGEFEIIGSLGGDLQSGPMNHTADERNGGDHI